MLLEFNLNNGSKKVMAQLGGIIFLFRNMRKRIYDITGPASEKDRLSNIYDIFMMIVILAIVVQLCFKTEYFVFIIIDKIALVIFIIDYVLRLIIADYT